MRRKCGEEVSGRKVGKTITPTLNSWFPRGMKNITFPPMAMGSRSDWTKSCKKIIKIRIRVTRCERHQSGLARRCDQILQGIANAEETGQIELTVSRVNWSYQSSSLSLLTMSLNGSVEQPRKRTATSHWDILQNSTSPITPASFNTRGRNSTRKREGRSEWQKKSFSSTPKFSAPD